MLLLGIYYDSGKNETEAGDVEDRLVKPVTVSQLSALHCILAEDGHGSSAANCV